MGFIKREQKPRHRYTREELAIIVDAGNEGLSARAIANLLAKRGFRRTEPSVAYIVRKLADSNATSLENFLAGNHDNDDQE